MFELLNTIRLSQSPREMHLSALASFQSCRVKPSLSQDFPLPLNIPTMHVVCEYSQLQPRLRISLP